MTDGSCHTATYCNLRQHTTRCCKTLHGVATGYAVLQRTPRDIWLVYIWFVTYIATGYAVLQRTTPYCNTLHCVATPFTVLQHTTPYCNTPHHGSATHYHTVLRHTIKRYFTYYNISRYFKTLHRIETHYTVLQHATLCCNTLHRITTHPERDEGLGLLGLTDEHVVCCSVLQCVAVGCSRLQWVAVCSSVM